MTAWRPTSWKAMFCEEWRAPVAIGSALKTRFGIGRRPLQHLHAAQRAAGDREQRLDAEAVEEHRLRAHHVADGDHRQVEAIGLVGRRIGRGRTGRAHAAADDVGADDEVAVGVDRLAGADHHDPTSPACRSPGGCWRQCWSPVSAWQIEDGVGAVAVELAVGLVGDLQIVETVAGIEQERLVRAEARDQARRVVGLVQRHGSRGRAAAAFDRCRIARVIAISGCASRRVRSS